MSVEGGCKDGTHKQKGGVQKSKVGAAPRYDALAKGLMSAFSYIHVPVYGLLKRHLSLRRT